MDYCKYNRFNQNGLLREKYVSMSNVIWKGHNKFLFGFNVQILVIIFH
jgi:hypothetical protein